MVTKKYLGQHWLKNRAILDEIANLAGEGEVCLEIGPGLGTLTSSLLRRFDRVVAVEFDKDLAEKLPASFPGKDLEVVNEDILKYDISKMPDNYVVCGNIPYYITSPIIERFISVEKIPSRIVLLIQKEVAERIASERESVLSLTVKNRADIELGPVVLAQEFTPPPEVDSQVIVLKPHVSVVDEGVLELIRKGFSQPRKKATRNLATVLSREAIKDIFISLKINVDARPSELHLEDWQKIYDKIYK